ncbi:unnamed protein product [Vicia faba]|uniref:Syntaxin 6/10/61 N-terminal domain-containing protein n=1 Tax=Vicia faba TaxID=3906 RepID=A0AAV0ZNF5_VICFA|nr:unnamed protein product [Vicia faba]
MASIFDRWEKDPFFNAAEEVQESADRVESTYRIWIHAMKNASSTWNSDELRRDLHTAMGTAKWQLDEFQRAVKSSYSKSSSDDARNRHQDFVAAIEGKISKVENLLQLHESVPLGTPLSPSGGKLPVRFTGRNGVNPQLGDRNSVRAAVAVEEKPHGHRRVASADADISSWKIAVLDDAQQSTSSKDSSGHTPMHKVASVSRFFGSVESISKFKWPKSGYRKLKAMDNHQETDNAPLPSTEYDGAIDDCNETSKLCLHSCDGCYNKPLQGWYGAFQRQLQRSQYQMQYNRPVQIAVWIVIILCLIVLIAFCAMQKGR